MAVTLIVLIRWFHALAATAWVGGMIFYLVVLTPLLRQTDSPQRAQLSAGLARAFGELTQAAIATLLLTGAVLTFDRLSQPHVIKPYVVVLAVKITLSVLMVGLASGLGRRRAPHQRPRRLTVPYLIMALGVLVYLLAVLLQVFFDTSYGAVS